MHAALSDLGLTVPVVAAPMAGGPTTPALVVAAANAGTLGFVAGGYLTADALAEQIATVRRGTSTFGVNLFAPPPVPVDRAEFARYAASVQAEAERYGVVLNTDPIEDDDHWAEKIALLRDDPVPVVSFTFALPDRSTIAALRAAGTLVVPTVTSADEARSAVEAGADALAVQSSDAGGHFGTWTPHRPAAPAPIGTVLAEVRAAVDVPLLAAGGIATARDVADVVHAGADVAMVGTVLLRCDESGASAVHQQALAEGRRESVITHAFTGRPARGLRNEFIDHHEGSAPLGYPALHHLTSPMRKASVAAGDPERTNLWAGTGYRHSAAEPAVVVLTRLATSA